MHHFIYPKQDTFITDTVGYSDLNFGLDEILLVGTQVKTVKVTSPTTTYPFSPNAIVANYCVFGFSGSISTGSFYGTASWISGSVFNDTDDPVTFTVDYFSGSLSGSVIGWESGSYISSSTFSGSLYNFSGSIALHSSSMPTWDALIDEFQNWQTVWDFSAFSGSIHGFVSGTFSSSYFGIFNGDLIGFSGKILLGTVNGAQVLNQQRQYYTESLFYNRALVQFDLTAISQAMADGDIVNPKFTLKMNVAREEELPISYSIYINPVSQSWVMGNGYVSDGGSDKGASWIYRDYQNGTPWAVTGSSFITNPGISQSFDYQVGDINIDVTPIVNAWITGSIPNYGFLIRSSDEVGASKTGMSLYFFSEDTNTIYVPRLDVGWDDFGWVTGSLSTASVYTFTSSVGLYGTLVDTSSMSGSFYGGFSGVGAIQVSFDGSSSYFWNEIDWSYVDWDEPWETPSGSAWGFIDVNGSSGLINGWHIFGNFSGSISRSLWQSFKHCKNCQPEFNEWWPAQNPGWYITNNSSPGFVSGPCSCGSTNPWWFDVQAPWWWTQQGQCCADSGSTRMETGGFQWVNKVTEPISSAGPCASSSYTGSWVTMSFLMGTLIDGPFSGSIFTSSLVNGYLLNHGIISGHWNSSTLVGTVITASYPLGPVFPSNVYVYFSGPYVGGMALGSLTNLSASSGVFDGTFVNGLYAGNIIHAPYSGTLATASVETTVVTLTSSSLSPVVFNRPFVTVIQNIPNVVKAGNVIRVNVFARPEFPLKNFNRQTQFEQFLIPQYLPTSSYYSIKDNETEEIILDFDNYTKISCDANGNYFMLDTTGLPQERYFRLLIKTEMSGSIYTFDRGDIFKIVR